MAKTRLLFFAKKAILKKFTKFIGKFVCLSLFLIKISRSILCNTI